MAKSSITRQKILPFRKSPALYYWLSSLCRSSAFICLVCNSLSLHFTHAESSHTEAIFSPFSVSDRSALTQLYGLPEPTSNQLSTAKRWQWSLSSDLINTSSQNLSATQFAIYQQNLNAVKGESIVLDGEIYRADVKLSYGLNEKNQISLQIPYLSHRGGFADSAIETWHDWFGLPNGNRDSRPRDAILYQYQINGVTQLQFDSASQGIGDLKFRYQFDFTPSQKRPSSDKNKMASSNRQVSRAGLSHPISRTVNVDLKLPTGSRYKLTGSGSTDLAFSLAFAQQRMSQAIPFSWHVSSGILWMSDNGLLAKQRKDFVVFANAQIGIKASARNRLKLQYQYHSAFYNSSTKELGSDSGQLVLGNSFQLNQRTVIDIYFTEDIKVRTAPDIGIGLAVKRFTD